MDRSEVVTYLTEKISPFAAQMIDDLPVSYGIKGTRWSDNLVVEDLKRILTPSIVRTMECFVVTMVMEKEVVYFCGVELFNN